VDDLLQKQYEYRRRLRVIGLSMDQVVTGLKNIIVFTNQDLWEKEGFGEARKDAEGLLLLAAGLESRLTALDNIYASFVPNNVEAKTVPPELQQP
jgi:hypothetical protein